MNKILQINTNLYDVLKYYVERDLKIFTFFQIQKLIYKDYTFYIIFNILLYLLVWVKKIDFFKKNFLKICWYFTMKK